MSANPEQSASSGLDMVKWTIVITLLAGVVIANNIFDQESVLIRALGIVAVALIAAFTAITTTKGKAFIEFAKESRMEVRKVVWPTTQETRQTTLIIFAATVVVGILLYFLDMGLRALVNFLTSVGI